MYVDDIKLAGEKKNIDSMQNTLMKHVDLEEPTSFLNHVHLGCTQRECKPNEGMVDEHRKVFELRISAGATEKFPESRKMVQTLLGGPTTWKDMRRDVLNSIANGQTKTIEQLYVSTPCLDDHQFKKR